MQNHDELVRPSVLGPALVAATGDSGWESFDYRLIAGGKSNLTFELSSAAGELILRRPPSGNLLPSAHDMGRESRVQRALAGTQVPVPQVVLTDEGDLLGVPCYVMAKVEGHVIREEFPAGYADDAAAKERIAGALVDTQSALHLIDPASIGMADFGRAEGFMARQVRRWTEQWDRSKTHDVAEMTELSHRLSTNIPTAQRVSIIHGDYRLDNCIMDADDPGKVAAVLDWELSALGDPLADLALTLFYWLEESDEPFGITPSITRTPGFPGRDFVKARYAEQTGLDLSDLGYYQGFSAFKLAGIVQGINQRSKAGAMAGQDFGNLDDMVLHIARQGLELL